MKSTSSPTLILNKAGKILNVNEAAIKLFNLNLTYIGYLAMDEPSNLKWAKFVKQLQNDLRSEEIFNIRIAGNEFEMMSFKCFYDPNTGEIVAQISTLNNDVAHRLYVSQEQERSQSFNAYDHLPYAVIVSDASGIILGLNKYAEMYLKLEKTQLLHKAHQHIFDSFTMKKGQITSYLSKLMGEKHASIHVVDETQVSRTCYYEISSVFDEYNNIIITVINDETEKKQLQHKVEHQQALNVVGQMAASIAHEIRNPLTSLKGFTELLKLNADEESRMYLSVIDSELQRMEQILSELLVLSKPTSMKVELLDLDNIVKQVIEFMLPDALMKNIMIQYISSTNQAAYIGGNENRLKQVFMNLIKNAMESMNNGGTITIEMNVIDCTMVELMIKDEGNGMDSSTLQNLFQPFYTTKSTGTGLGLAFVKKVIEEHEGLIGVNSELQKGTCFHLQFPIYTFNQMDAVDVSSKDSAYLVT
ncbi:PAS domain-containing sensor histidine kinase [Lysinibacillus pakistanensis]|nr:ATP-binding protein [Lysinibacillus pakistanensis]MDM5231974.1 ATP-binding protein [Lysinibacillus pakistanensis]WHY47503.1 ATP-binding protein [Lysinibacillus pakistanensis]WHY52513.1 ATP-binding protein [Lysinibacillus pakistanensis]